MRNIVVSWIFLATAVGCRNDEISSIEYRSLGDTVFAYLRPYALDVDLDGSADFNFVTSLTSGGGESSIHFLITSIGAHRVVYDTLTEKIPVYQSGDPIGPDLRSHETWDAFASHLGEKRYFGTSDSVWSGEWTRVQQPYIPVSLYKTAQPHYGWIRISFDTTRAEVVLHETAYETRAGMMLRAGEK